MKRFPLQVKLTGVMGRKKMANIDPRVEIFCNTHRNLYKQTNGCNFAN